jgi:hypothetical protein
MAKYSRAVASSDRSEIEGDADVLYPFAAEIWPISPESTFSG